MSFRLCLLSAALLTLTAAIPGLAAPLKVNSGNEAVIEPLIIHPDETPCIVPLVTGATFGANAVTYTYTPPAACPGRWAKVILKMQISLNEGRQFDRSGLLFLAGVPLWFGTTAEPRATLSPKWSFEKDVTDYTALYSTTQTGSLIIGNYQSSVYTSTITASATLSFYPATTSAPAPVTADVVLPVPTGGGLATLGSASDTLSLTATLPKNILRATMDLYLQGQSDDEFWYLSAPSDVAGELETYGNTPFREGEITLDGTPAGVAPVYPWIFTGGIDPYLWQPIPGVQTFNFIPFHADLSPFAGVLSNGSTHTIATSVYNDNNYFSATGALRLFLDKNATTVTGSIKRNTLGAPAPKVVENITTTDGVSSGTILVASARDFTITGTVTGSAGTTENTLHETSVFSNKGRYNVSAAKELQVNTQTTDTTIVTTAKTGGTTSTHTETLSFPLTVYYDFTAAKNGNSYTQITNINQQYIANSFQELNGTPVSQDTLTDAILAGDTLFFNSAFMVTGHKSQSETATYARTGTSAPCFKRTLVSTFSVLSSVQTGC